MHAFFSCNWQEILQLRQKGWQFLVRYCKLLKDLLVLKQVLSYLDLADSAITASRISFQLKTINLILSEYSALKV
jgi:hypothetical protein